jgi:predicted PurR-regulated permease PerM
MTTNNDVAAAGENKEKVSDIVIRLGVLALVVIWCFQILQPFVIPVVWAIIIAVAIFPVYHKLSDLLGGRRGLAATLIAMLFLVLLMVPTIMLAKALVQNVAILAEEFRSGQLAIPPPPDNVQTWPLIGDHVSNIWQLAANNLADVLKPLEPQLKAFGTWLVKLAGSAGMSMLMFIVAVVIAGVLLAHSGGSHRVVHGIARRLAGERGDELANLAEATIRNVARGVLGVAVIQALMAGLGFLVAGVPGAGIWALLCLILATVQIGVGPIVIPTIVYVFATGDTLTAVVFLIWNIIVLVLDNILKPILMGRGVDVPMVVIFLGAIGGMLMSGIVGLFVGAMVLAVGYKLFQAWLNLQAPLPQENAGSE